MTQTTHGTPIGKVKITLTGTGGGLTVYVKPLTMTVARALSDKAAQAYPYPDEKLYQRTRSELADAMPSIDGSDTLSAKDNPAYLQACAEIDKTRALWLTDAAVDVCVTCDAKDVLIAAYASELAAMRTLGVTTRLLPWADTLYHFLCAVSQGGISEWAILIETINGNMPLTEGETQDGMIFFRLDLQRYIRQRIAANTRSPRIEGAIENSLFGADGRDERLSELGDDIRPDPDGAKQLAIPTAPNAGIVDRAASTEPAYRID